MEGLPSSSSGDESRFRGEAGRRKGRKRERERKRGGEAEQVLCMSSQNVHLCQMKNEEAIL